MFSKREKSHSPPSDRPSDLGVVTEFSVGGVNKDNLVPNQNRSRHMCIYIGVYIYIYTYIYIIIIYISIYYLFIYTHI